MAALLFSAVALTQPSDVSANDFKERLSGSWYATVTTPSQGSFPGLLTFTSDGSVLADESPFAYESSGHGSWVNREYRDGHREVREVAYTFVHLIGSAEGRNTGRVRVSGTLQPEDKQYWQGPFKIEVFDANGQITFSDRGTIRLTRIPVEPLT
jgi:hypothetical protein